ncbi:unnamed protein product [Adineta steineri]|uniref:Uncharacterized protein n=1 Tax=Adineta steineri TaxID=433720 RepID=A0A815PHM4_9BILA|nr:unnamed protein product [Adineta steineri]CAF3936849.1 unnamed protein product [Adineta steineri]
MKYYKDLMKKNQTWLIFTKDDKKNILSSLLPCSNIEIFDILSIIFAWQLDQVLLNGNNDDLAFKQNEELIYGTLSRIVQIIQKSSPYFYLFVYVLTDHALFNNDSNLNIIPSPFIGLARSLITEYERNRLKLIDLQTSLNNQSTFIYTLIEYMINSRYSTDTCEVVLRLSHTNQNQTDFVDHISSLIYIILEETFDLFVQCKLRAVEPTVSYEPSEVIEALLRCNSGQVMGEAVFRISSSDQPLNIHKIH